MIFSCEKIVMKFPNTINTHSTAFAKTKLFQILSGLDRYEQNKLRKFVASPYFNMDQTIVELYDFLIKIVNEGGIESTTRVLIWDAIKKEKPYNDTRFRKYCSDLLRLVQDYFSISAFEANPVHKASYFVKSLDRFDSPSLREKMAKKVQKILNQKEVKQEPEEFFFDYRINRAIFEMKQTRGLKDDINLISRSLDLFFITEKMTLLCEAFSQRYISSFDYLLSFEQEVVQSIKKDPSYLEVPLISAAYWIYLLYTEPEVKSNYDTLKEILRKYALSFSRRVAKAYYNHALNYAISQLNKGNQEFLKELFLLYKDLLESRIIIEKNKITPASFRNICVTALRIGEYEWTSDFISTYSEFLPESMRDNTVTYTQAQVYLYQGNYDKVIEKLRDVEYEDITYNLNSKAMLVASFYELDEIEPLFSLLESFRAYLNRKKEIADFRRIAYLNLIKYTKRLTRILPGDTKAIQKFREDLIKETANGVGSIKWLEEKIDELEGVGKNDQPEVTTQSGS